MIIYVVCEDYTCAFYGMFSDIKKANKVAKKIGGFVLKYQEENGKFIAKPIDKSTEV